MDNEPFLITIFFLINGSAWLYFKNPFETRYINKTTKIKVAVLGYLERIKDELVEKEITNPDELETAQEKRYEAFIEYFRRSKFLVYISDYEDVVEYEKTGETLLDKIAISTFALIIPVIIYWTTQNFPLSAIASIIPLEFVILLTKDYYKMCSRINELYNLYVKEKESFGGYD